MNLLPAIILRAQKQRDKVQRLVDYVRELDGTELRVVNLPPEIDKIPHPLGVEHAIRWIGEQMQEPWLYLEADSPPIQKGWLKTITDEYRASGKTFMLPSLEGLSGHDVASAIGVWPAQLQQYLPKEIPTEWPYFDFHVYQKHTDQIHFTKSIQHSYCCYRSDKGNENRIERRHEFPRDKAMLRPEAVVFHADPAQSIIRGGLLQSFFHSGDAGDIIAALPVIKKQGGGRLVIGPHHDTVATKCPRELMNRTKFENLRPLLELQPYLKTVEYSEDWKGCDHDFSQFRLSPMLPHENLATWQARNLGRADDNFDLEPWINVEAQHHGRVVVSRSGRYLNPQFPWELVAKKYGNKLLFVGTEYEHKFFEHVVGIRVEKAKTKDALELAKVIAGASLQFSNQSLPFWLGAGLGKSVIQETFPAEPNSVIERKGLSYTRNQAELAATKRLLE